MKVNFEGPWPELDWPVLIILFTLLVGFIFTGTKMMQYQLANVALAQLLAIDCKAQIVGEVVALVIIENEVTCIKRYEGMPKSIWQRNTQKKKS